MLQRLFNPKSIAIIGASRQISSVGNDIVVNLKTGGVFKSEFSKPYRGKIYLVNPNAKKIFGMKCYAKVTDISDIIDVAIIATQPKIALEVMSDIVKKQIPYVIIISAGFAEASLKGKELQDKILAIAKKNKIRLVGPNCLGILNTKVSLNASFAPSTPPKGDISFISQSGALADSIIDWAIENRYGFSKIISLGNQSDLDISDFLEHLGKDKDTRVIAAYIESLKDGRKFIKVASKVTRVKPIVVIKAGRTSQAKKAISSHTGNLTSDYEIYKAAFRRSGVYLADSVEELFDVSKTLCEQPRAKNSVAIITNGGGAGVLMTDYLSGLGVKISKIKYKTLKKLDPFMHPAYSRSNPLDLVGDATPNIYKKAINVLLSEKYINALVVMQTLQAMTDPIKDAKIIIAAKKKFPKKPIVCVYMGGKFSKKGIDLLNKNNIPDFNDPKKAALALNALIIK